MSDLSLTAAGNLTASGGGEEARLRKAATQFEAAFLQQLFQQLENSQIDDEPLFGGDSATRQFTSLFHHGLSEQAAGGLGLSEMVFKELSARAGLPGAQPAALASTLPAMPLTQGAQP